MATHVPSAAATLAGIGSLFGVASAASLIRLAVPVLVDRRIMWRDYWVLAAFIFFSALFAADVVFLGLFYLLLDPIHYDNDMSRMGPNITKLVKLTFATNMLLWAILWSVKFSFLALYRTLIKEWHKAHLWYWRACVSFSATVSRFLRAPTLWLTTFRTIFINVALSLLSCRANPRNTFVVGRCVAPADKLHVDASFWSAFIFDIMADISRK
ncbi:hypothetical protein ANO11243_091710 [Dothideomycetidae sp. 11243]|nr:hypothetical protein ANO11243_091710 [fungal sp. No.11243]